MDKSMTRRSDVLCRLRQFEQGKAEAAMLRAAYQANSAHESRDVRREEAEAVGQWKVPAANGGHVELSVYAHAVQVEASAMAHWAEADDQANEADRALGLAHDRYGHAVLAKDVIERRRQRIATLASIESEHRDADAVNDMWLARRRHGHD